MASIHAEVPSDENIEVSHEIVDTIERECLKKLGIFLVIHMDPVETHNEQVTAIKKEVAHVLEGLDSRLEFHDLRVVDGSRRINLIFDLVVPRDYNEAMRDTLRTRVSEEMRMRGFKVLLYHDHGEQLLRGESGINLMIGEGWHAWREW